VSDFLIQLVTASYAKHKCR